MPDVFVDKKNKQESCPEEKPSVWKKIKEPLQAFVSYPKAIRFESQGEEEEVVLLLRRHIVTNFPWLTASFLMFLAPTVFFPLLSFFQLSLPLRFHLVFTLFWYLLTFGLAVMGFINWYFNVYLVTNERIVDVDFINLLYRQISSTRIEKIQDVSYRVRGIIRAFFDYGDVFIQTAGTEENFEFEAVPHPEVVTKKLVELMEKKAGPGV